MRLKFDNNGKSLVSQKKYLKNEFNRLRDICISSDGKIYLATNGANWTNDKPFTHSIVELSNESFVSVGNAENSVDVRIGSNPLDQGKPLYVKFPDGKHGELTLYDVFGRLVTKSKVQGEQSIELNLTAGIYLWNVELDGGEMSEGKLIVR